MLASRIGVLLGILAFVGGLLAVNVLGLGAVAIGFGEPGAAMLWLVIVLLAIVVPLLWGIAAIKLPRSPVAGALGIAESAAASLFASNAGALVLAGVLWGASGVVLMDFALRVWCRSGAARGGSAFLALIPLLLLVVPPAVGFLGEPYIREARIEHEERQRWLESSLQQIKEQASAELSAKKNWVLKFDANGAFLGKWGSYGTAAGQFTNNTLAITVDRAGNVYVLEDHPSYRVLKFSPEGRYILHWDLKGPRSGGQLFAHGIAADGGGNVYIVTSEEVQKFGPNGQFLTRWPLPWEYYGTVVNIAVHSSGNIYVAKYRGVVVFNGEGRMLTSWATGNGGWNTRGIDVDSSGNVYVIYRLQADDVPPFTTEVDSSGNVRVLPRTLGYPHSVRKFSSQGALIAESEVLRSYEPKGIAVDRLGNLYWADSRNSRVLVLDSAGKFLKEWTSPGTWDGQFESLRDIAVDEAGNVWVLDG